ncbi:MULTISPECIES: hypothetical protein [Xanthomonas]|uniref:hypothetical protein n=1 Tax=Xanthomonas TaxID=338 RepID=UPI000F8C5CA0|nr:MULTISPECIES: hypothetical protein [Xanthomonas]MBB4767742.1 hypothetical protein [Xanthomonas arboricola]
MSAVEVKVCLLGTPPRDLDVDQIERWRSDFILLSPKVERLSLRCDTDLDGWAYSDRQISTQLPPAQAQGITICVTRVPLEDNWYARRVSDRHVVFSLFEIGDFLRAEQIPLSNAVLRVAYAYAISTERNSGVLPKHGSAAHYTHDETRGCLFDMNGLKADIVESCVQPVICEECRERMRQSRFSNEKIDLIVQEIRGIDRSTYNKIRRTVERYPYRALTISTLFVLITGVLASFTASLLFELFRTQA